MSTEPNLIVRARVCAAQCGGEPAAIILDLCKLAELLLADRNDVAEALASLAAVMKTRAEGEETN